MTATASRSTSSPGGAVHNWVHAWTWWRIGLTIIAVAGLAVDAYVHLDLAHNYVYNTTSHLSQADLFRFEAVVSILAAVALVVRPRRYTGLIAVVVAGSALFVVLLYRYANVGKIGPLPNMYEPSWYAEKTQSAWAEGIALVAALPLATLRLLRSTPSAGQHSVGHANETEED